MTRSAARKARDKEQARHGAPIYRAKLVELKPHGKLCRNCKHLDTRFDRNACGLGDDTGGWYAAVKPDTHTCLQWSPTGGQQP